MRANILRTSHHQRYQTHERYMWVYFRMLIRHLRRHKRCIGGASYIGRELSYGYSVELEGLGHFSPSVKSKEVTDQKGNTKSSASIHGVNFRCSPRLKEMVKKNAPILVKRENLPKTGIEGRKAKMLSYLERNSYINLTDYAGLNNCTRYRASEDIKQFIKDNVIASVGYRTHRIYVLPEKEDGQN